MSNLIKIFEPGKIPNPNQEDLTIDKKFSLGIDLGTTRTVVSYKDKKGKIQIIKSQNGKVFTIT